LVDARSPAVEAHLRPVFSVGQTVVAACFGGPLAGGLSVSMSLRRLGRPVESARALQWSVFLAVGEAFVVALAPLPSAVLLMVNAVAAKLAFDRWLALPFSRHVTAGGAVVSPVVVLAVIVLPLLAMTALFTLFDAML
jgi:hypothetical protein